MIALVKNNFRWMTLALGILTVQSSAASAMWQETVRIVVPYSAGGANDVMARLFAHALTGKLAKSVIVENRPGAGGAIAVKAVGSSPADGRTLLYSASVTEIQSSKPQPMYDISKDCDAVIMNFEAPYIIYVNASLPIKTLQELLAYDKKDPGKLSYASFGVGSGPHLAMEWLKEWAGLKFVHVPYRSSLESLNAVLKNEAQISLDTYAPLAAHFQAGSIRPLAATGLVREKSAPNVPTVDESGVKGYSITYTSGILVPKGTPKEVIEELNAAFNEILKDPEVRKGAERYGFSPVGGSSSKYQQALEKNISGFRQLIVSAGIQF